MSNNEFMWIEHQGHERVQSKKSFMCMSSRSELIKPLQGYCLEGKLFAFCEDDIIQLFINCGGRSNDTLLENIIAFIEGKEFFCKSPDMIVEDKQGRKQW